MGKKIDLTGRRFGRWIVLEVTTPFVRESGKTDSRYICRCDCGTKRTIKAKDLLCGSTKSCGCLRSDLMKKRRTTHGMTNTRLFRIWDGMKQRCGINSETHKHWAGKGIQICDEWLGDSGFQNFYDWSIQNGYDEHLSIDRINSDGNYCPENCRWVDSYVQNNNSSNNTHIFYKGEVKTIGELAREHNIKYQTLYSRIAKGWEIERALTKGAK